MNVFDRKKPEAPAKPVSVQGNKAISIAYDTHNMRLIALCEDGALWARHSERDEMGNVKWHWQRLEDFKPE